MRKHWLDNIRWTIVVLVVFYHVVYMYNAQGISGGVGKITSLENQWYDMFMYILYPWFMALLFIVSGISSRFYLGNHTQKEFVKSRTTKLLVPSTIGLFCFQFIQGYINMSMPGVFESLSDIPKFVLYLIMCGSGVGVLWYIQLLWIFSILLLLVRKIEKNRLWSLCSKVNIWILIVLVVLVWGCAQILNTPIFVVYRFGFYGIMFLLGYFVFSHEEVIEVLKKWFFLFAAVSIVLCVFFCAAYFGKNCAESPINKSPLFVAFSWFTCLAMLGCFSRFFDFENSFTSWMNRHSWGLYVFHYLGISAVAVFLGLKGIIPAWSSYLLSLIAGFAGGYLLNAIISRIPFLRWAVLGIKKPAEVNTLKV